MSQRASFSGIRPALLREYGHASLIAGSVGILICLGGMMALMILYPDASPLARGILTAGVMMAGVMITLLALNGLIRRRLLDPLAGMLTDLDLYLKQRDPERINTLGKHRTLGAVAEECENLVHDMILQQQQLEDVHERFQTMIARLSEAKETAEQADLAKTQFMARMSHEIRTPINGVLGMTELLLDSALTDSQARLARIIRDSGKTLLGIIDGLLDFAKLEVDKLVLESTPFDLHKLAEDVVCLVAPTAHAKHLDIACCIDPRLPVHVSGDPFRLRQVLLNLIGNAIKFTAEGEIALDIILDQGRVRFEVSDTGVGIATESRDLIFEPFAQASVQVSRQFGGTGLGLSIARQLVQLMGGDLTVDSTVNVGSVFRFTIDLPVAITATSVPPQNTLAERRILIIENSDASARALGTRLTALGARNVWVTNMTDGFERLRQGQSSGKPFDAVIAADQAGGVEFLRRVQDNPLFSDLRIIITAPLNRVQALEHLPEMAQTLILTKPLTREGLDTAVHKIKSGKPLPPRTRIEAPTTPSPLPQTPVGTAVLLVAEDNPVNAEVASRMLRGAGYTVDIATNGREAVVAAQKTRYHLILMDGQMPELDGVDAARAIRAHYQQLAQPCPPPPIIAVTADAFDNARSRYLAEGMDDFIAKPFQRDDLLMLVKRWMRPDVNPSVTLSGYDNRDGPNTISSPSQDLPIVDRAVLAGIAQLGGGEDRIFLEHLIEIYCQDMSVSLAHLATAVGDADYTTVRKIAHKMKSSSANLGAKYLAALAARLEHNATAATLDDVHAVQNAYTKAADTLRTFLAGGVA